MKPGLVRRWARNALGRMPLSAELYQSIRQDGNPPSTGYRLERLAAALPRWSAVLRQTPRRAEEEPPRRVLIVSYLSWWLEHTSALSILLASQSHQVDLAYLPYRNWIEPSDAFDAHRQAAYLRRVLEGAEGWFRARNMLRGRPAVVPEDLAATIGHQSLLDVQYSLQREEVDVEGPGPERDLYRLRLERNRHAAGAAIGLLERCAYDVVIVPNGSILEFGAVYHAARHTGVPVVTYEFGEQRGRLWLARGAQVMRQDTAEMWAERGQIPLTAPEQERLENMYRARRGGQSWSNFARQWQSGMGRGAAVAREALGLDSSLPTVLICTNVVGDSLALDRQIFTQGMSDWLARTVRHLASHSNLQVVVRVHPGELLGAGQPSVDIVRRSLPDFGHRVTVIPPDSDVNTYDLIGLAHLGLVYSSTVGMELAMGGVPVIVCGQTHYREKGFTDDPRSWDAFVRILEQRLGEPAGRRLPPEQVDLARRYAFRFFFEYPFEYPWHLIGFWDDMATRPMESVLRPDLAEPYRRTLRALTGHPVEWAARAEPAEAWA